MTLRAVAPAAVTSAGLGTAPLLIWTSVAAPGTAAGFQLPAMNQSAEVLPVH